jgi:hypothetical protein
MHEFALGLLITIIRTVLVSITDHYASRHDCDVHGVVAAPSHSWDGLMVQRAV